MPATHKDLPLTPRAVRDTGSRRIFPETYPAPYPGKPGKRAQRSGGVSAPLPLRARLRRLVHTIANRHEADAEWAAFFARTLDRILDRLEADARSDVRADALSDRQTARARQLLADATAAREARIGLHRCGSDPHGHQDAPAQDAPASEVS